MTTPPESIQVGQCHLARALGYRKPLRVRRVLGILPDGRVQFDQRRGPIPAGRPWRRAQAMDLAAFASQVERPVPCDWTPEQDE